MDDWRLLLVSDQPIGRFVDVRVIGCVGPVGKQFLAPLQKRKLNKFGQFSRIFSIWSPKEEGASYTLERVTTRKSTVTPIEFSGVYSQISAVRIAALFSKEFTLPSLVAEVDNDT